ncbi:MAG: MFS transporter, partial [Kovacikia sp.]
MVGITLFPQLFGTGPFRMGLFGKIVWLAQAPFAPDTSRLNTPEAASVVFSGPHFFTALISGVLLAFGFQLLFTNLSVAAGISYLGRSSHSEEDAEDGLSIRKIGFGVGLWTLITVTIALFAACYLAVQMSLLTAPLLGATVGLVIWATYFSLLVWVSSTTIGSLVGSVVGAATSGFQAILGTASAAIGGKVAQQQVVSTAEAVAAAVRNELTAGVDPEHIRESIQDYIGRLQLPGFDLSKIRRDFEDLLNDPEFAALTENDHLRQVDRRTFIDLISRRTDFTKEEVTRLADLLEGVWQQTLGRRQRRDQVSELVDYLKSAQPGQLKVDELNARLDRLLAERGQAQTAASEQKSTGLQQTLQSGLNTAIGLLVGRTDLSDLDLEKILERVKTAPDRVTEQSAKVVKQLQGDRSDGLSPGTIRTDVEHYLLHTYSWQMNQTTIAKDFRSVLYDPDADPAEVADQVARLNRSYFVELLTSRGVFSQARIQEIA